MRTAAVLCVLMAAGCADAPLGRVVYCYPVHANGWNFECEVTGQGAEKHEGQFSPQFINAIASQGNDLNRSFRGERWWAIVKVEGAGRKTPVQSGKEYKMFGTVTDISGGRVKFTDCVFAPVEH